MQFPDFFPNPEDETLFPVSLCSEDVEIPFELPDELLLAEWLRSMAYTEGAPLEEVNYIFCSDEYLLKMNNEFLQHDYYTDVITFQTTPGALHGDIYISIDRVADNATQLNTPFLTELLRVMAHGALHLAGYGDKTPEEEASMRQKEDEYLVKLDDLIHS